MMTCLRPLPGPHPPTPPSRPALCPTHHEGLVEPVVRHHGNVLCLLLSERMEANQVYGACKGEKARRAVDKKRISAEAGGRTKTNTPGRLRTGCALSSSWSPRRARNATCVRGTKGNHRKES